LEWLRGFSSHSVVIQLLKVLDIGMVEIV